MNLTHTVSSTESMRSAVPFSAAISGSIGQRATDKRKNSTKRGIFESDNPRDTLCTIKYEWPHHVAICWFVKRLRVWSWSIPRDTPRGHIWKFQCNHTVRSIPMTLCLQDNICKSYRAPSCRRHHQILNPCQFYTVTTSFYLQTIACVLYVEFKLWRHFVYYILNTQ